MLKTFLCPLKHNCWLIKCAIYMHTLKKKKSCAEMTNDPKEWRGCCASLRLLPVDLLAAAPCSGSCWAVLIMYIIKLGSTCFIPQEWCVFNDSNALPSICNLTDGVLVSLTTINQHQGLSICREKNRLGWDFFFSYRALQESHIVPVKSYAEQADR